MIKVTRNSFKMNVDIVRSFKHLSNIYIYLQNRSALIVIDFSAFWLTFLLLKTNMKKKQTLKISDLLQNLRSVIQANSLLWTDSKLVRAVENQTIVQNSRKLDSWSASFSLKPVTQKVSWKKID